MSKRALSVTINLCNTIEVDKPLQSLVIAFNHARPSWNARMDPCSVIPRIVATNSGKSNGKENRTGADTAIQPSTQ